MCVCLSLSFFFCVFLSLCVSVCLAVSFSMCLCPSLFLSVCVYLCLYLCVCEYVSVSMCAHACTHKCSRTWVHVEDNRRHWRPCFLRQDLSVSMMSPVRDRLTGKPQRVSYFILLSPGITRQITTPNFIFM